MEIRRVLESGEEQKYGWQSVLAKKYAASRDLVSRIVKSERERYRNPYSWEMKKAKKENRQISIYKLMKDLENHPNSNQTKRPEN